MAALKPPSSLPLALPSSATDSAHPLPALSDVEVVARKRVTVNAVGLPSLLSRGGDPTQDIFALGCKLKVRWAYAKSYPAEVVEGQAFRNRTVHLLPEPAMSTDHLALSRQSEGAVLAPVAGALAARPNPALAKVRPAMRDRPALADLLKKSLVWVLVPHEWIVALGVV